MKAQRNLWHGPCTSKNKIYSIKLDGLLSSLLGGESLHRHIFHGLASSATSSEIGGGFLKRPKSGTAIQEELTSEFFWEVLEAGWNRISIGGEYQEGKKDKGKEQKSKGTMLHIWQTGPCTLWLLAQLHCEECCHWSYDIIYKIIYVNRVFQQFLHCSSICRSWIF